VGPVTRRPRAGVLRAGPPARPTLVAGRETCIARRMARRIVAFIYNTLIESARGSIDVLPRLRIRISRRLHEVLRLRRGSCQETGRRFRSKETSLGCPG